MIGVVVPKNSEARKIRSAGFLLSAAMKFPEPLESRMYGDPMEVYSAKQSQAANQAKKQAAQTLDKRPIHAVKPRADGEWSEARKAAEALFSIPGRT